MTCSDFMISSLTPSRRARSRPAGYFFAARRRLPSTCVVNFSGWPGGAIANRIFKSSGSVNSYVSRNRGIPTAAALRHSIFLGRSGVDQHHSPGGWTHGVHAMPQGPAGRGDEGPALATWSPVAAAHGQPPGAEMRAGVPACPGDALWDEAGPAGRGHRAVTGSPGGVSTCASWGLGVSGEPRPGAPTLTFCDWSSPQLPPTAGLGHLVFEVE